MLGPLNHFTDKSRAAPRPSGTYRVAATHPDLELATLGSAIRRANRHRMAAAEEGRVAIGPVGRAAISGIRRILADVGEVSSV